MKTTCKIVYKLTNFEVVPIFQKKNEFLRLKTKKSLVPKAKKDPEQNVPQTEQKIQNFDTNIINKPNGGARSKGFMVGKFWFPT